MDFLDLNWPTCDCQCPFLGCSEIRHQPIRHPPCLSTPTRIQCSQNEDKQGNGIPNLMTIADLRVHGYKSVPKTKWKGSNLDMNITGVKRASGAWKRSGPIFITLPSGNCVERTQKSMRMNKHNSCHYHFLDSRTHASFWFPLANNEWSINRP
jgi:hypothetical protein